MKSRTQRLATLWKQFQATGKPTFKNQIVEHYYPVIRRQIDRYLDKHPRTRADAEDIFQAAVVEIIQLMPKHTHKSVDQLPTMIYLWTKYTIIEQEGYSAIHLSRRKRRTALAHLKAWHKEKSQLEASEGRHLTDDEAALTLGPAPKCPEESLWETDILDEFAGKPQTEHKPALKRKTLQGLLSPKIPPKYKKLAERILVDRLSVPQLQQRYRASSATIRHQVDYLLKLLKTHRRLGPPQSPTQ